MLCISHALFCLAAADVSGHSPPRQRILRGPGCVGTLRVRGRTSWRTSGITKCRPARYRAADLLRYHVMYSYPLRWDSQGLKVLEQGAGQSPAVSPLPNKRSARAVSRSRHFPLSCYMSYPPRWDSQGLKVLEQGAGQSPAVSPLPNKRSARAVSRSRPFSLLCYVSLSPNAGSQRDEVPFTRVWGEQPQRNSGIPGVT